MKIRAKSVLKLTNGRVNMDYTFVNGATLEHVAEQLLIQLAFESGKESVLELAKKAVDKIE